MKSLTVLVALLGILISFQNCGETNRTNTLLQEQSILQEASCESDGSCLQPAEFLWIAIREYDPYKIELSTVNGGHFNVAGQCGVGTFQEHSFLWELREGFGAQNIVGQSFVNNRCINGQFSIPIDPQINFLEVDKRYNLTVELVGITNTGGEVSNPLPDNIGTVDIIFTAQPPK